MSSRLCLYYRTLLLDRDGLLSFDEYCSFYLRLSKLLLAPHFHLALAKANAEADWARDMRGCGGGGEGRMMDCDTFCHSLFEMMDEYVVLHDAQQMVFLLNAAYTLLTHTTSSSSQSYAYSSATPPSSSSTPSSSVVTFVPLSSIDDRMAFNRYTRHNSDYNHYTHTAAHALHTTLHDTDIEFTVPLLPPLSVDPLPATSAATAAGESAVGGLKQGPTRNGLHCSIGAMDAFITLHSPYAPMLPASWSLARWQRDNQKKQQAEAAAARMEEEKQNAAMDDSRPTASVDREEPFIVRERRERAANRLRTAQTVTLGSSGGRSSSSSRRDSVVMDIDDGAGDSTTAASLEQRGRDSVIRRLSRFI